MADLGDIPLDLTPELLHEKSAGWLRIRVIGLLAKDSRLSRAIAHQSKSNPEEPASE